MLDVTGYAEEFDRLGYLSPVPILTPQEAHTQRAALDRAEAEHGSMHLKAKVHTLMPEVWEMATHPAILDVVEALIGPDILLYDATYIIKEAQSPSFVSWHQDLTFWGLSADDQVSLWLALSAANQASGCMRMIPGSHKAGRAAHVVGEDADNVLLQSQTVGGVNEADAVLCPLAPGEASFHHGWTLHASMPNVSDTRRIGLNVQFIAPHVRQTKHSNDSAILVRGEDRYRHFAYDTAATGWFTPEAMRTWEELNRRQKETQGSS